MTSHSDMPEVEGNVPTQLVRLPPAEVTLALAESLGERPFQPVPCNPLSTLPGDRLALYERGTGRGIVAVADVHSEPVVSDEGSRCWAVVRELGSPISREDLARAGLEVPLRRARPASHLTEPEQLRLRNLLSPWPPFTTNSQPLPADPATVPLMEYAEGELWASESEMQRALASDVESLKGLALGFPPVLEERFRGGRMRFDISGPGVIVECKLFATMESLHQLERYLAARREDEPEVDWTGVLVAGLGYTRDLVVTLDRLAQEATTAGTEPIELFMCVRRPGGVLLTRQDRTSIPLAAYNDTIANELLGLLHACDLLGIVGRELAAMAGVDEETGDMIEDLLERDPEALQTRTSARRDQQPRVT